MPLSRDSVPNLNSLMVTLSQIAMEIDDAIIELETYDAFSDDDIQVIDWYRSQLERLKDLIEPLVRRFEIDFQEEISGE